MNFYIPSTYVNVKGVITNGVEIEQLPILM